MQTSSNSIPMRLSPIHAELEHLGASWGVIADMPVALDFGDAVGEAQAARKLGLCDVSALPRVMIKGPSAKTFLQSQGFTLPDAIYETLALHQEGLLTRTGGMEYFLEDGPSGTNAISISNALEKNVPGVVCVPRQDASFFLSGTHATEVLLQTCGYEFHNPQKIANFVPNDARMVFTRIAGVSCSVLPRMIGGIGLFQLWLDGTFGESLWETLLEITRQADGKAVGLNPFYTGLTSHSSLKSMGV